eukprot:2505536-Amphidinium_carterae.1
MNATGKSTGYSLNFSVELNNRGHCPNIQSYLGDVVTKLSRKCVQLFFQLGMQVANHIWWVSRTTGERYGFASFTFWVYDGMKVDPARRAILELCPGMSDGQDGFQAAKYNKGHHIKPHDDFLSYVQDGDHRTASGKVFPNGTTMFRNLAIVYYLVPDWMAEYGGCLIDHGCPSGPRTIVPVFNSLVAFLVPRQHEVSQVIGTGPQTRYSVFGWFADSTPTPEASKAMEALNEESEDYEAGFPCS